MGYWKKEFEDREGRPEYDSPGTYVCTDCLTDPYLAGLVNAKLEEEPCSYCDSPKAADISIVCDAMADAIARLYTDPAQELSYDGGEGGYFGEVLSGSEIITGEFEDWTDCDSLRDDVSEAFARDEWCRRNSYGLTPYESLDLSWQSFCDVVKRRTRYFFLKEPEARDTLDEKISPGEMMDELGRLFHESELFLELPQTDLFRARVVSTGTRLATAAELGTAPPEAARFPNRMSPAGIPMFYAALDEDVAVLETYDARKEQGQEIAIGVFRAGRALRLLNLANLPPIPSVFDPSQSYENPRIAFLHSFESDFTKPVSREDEAYTEYVPTQVVTEYVRHHLRTPTGEHVDGILYQSSRMRDALALVIFAESKDCGPRVKGLFDRDPLLQLVRVEHLDSSDIRDVIARNNVRRPEEVDE
jgi:hypothetical protein